MDGEGGETREGELADLGRSEKLQNRIQWVVLVNGRDTDAEEDDSGIDFRLAPFPALDKAC